MENSMNPAPEKVIKNTFDKNCIRFSVGDMQFEYSADKNEKNVKKHGISLKNAARVFFDYNRIEMFDEENSGSEERYDTIGDIGKDHVIFVVYTERIREFRNGKMNDVTRLISARYATNFERGLYYGKY